MMEAMEESGVKIMGVINLNDDSFWRGSRCSESALAARVENMLCNGADILDLGAVSTGPGSREVDAGQEWERLSGPVKILKSLRLPAGILSFDTFRAVTVDRILQELGEKIIVNDITAGGFSTWVAGESSDDTMFRSPMLALVGKYSLPYVAMHMRGTPQTMQDFCIYRQGVVEDVLDYFRRFGEVASRYGISSFVADPGFGFSKTLEQNWDLFEALPLIKRGTGRRILVGISRKSMIYKKFGITPEQALEPTVIYGVKAASMGADILRVHDVGETVQALRECECMREPAQALRECECMREPVQALRECECMREPAQAACNLN